LYKELAFDSITTIGIFSTRRPILIMRLSILVATLLATLALAVPASVEMLETRAYTGPCAQTNCGVTGKNCGYLLCVPWPHTDLELRKGCTCSYG
jgi:hypothetical protein